MSCNVHIITKYNSKNAYVFARASIMSEVASSNADDDEMQRRHKMEHVLFTNLLCLPASLSEYVVARAALNKDGECQNPHKSGRSRSDLLEDCTEDHTVPITSVVDNIKTIAGIRSNCSYVVKGNREAMRIINRCLESAADSLLQKVPVHEEVAEELLRVAQCLLSDSICNDDIALLEKVEKATALRRQNTLDLVAVCTALARFRYASIQVDFLVEVHKMQWPEGCLEKEINCILNYSTDFHQQLRAIVENMHCLSAHNWSSAAPKWMQDVSHANKHCFVPTNEEFAIYILSLLESLLHQGNPSMRIKAMLVHSILDQWSPWLPTYLKLLVKSVHVQHVPCAHEPHRVYFKQALEDTNLQNSKELWSTMSPAPEHVGAKRGLSAKEVGIVQSDPQMKQDLTLTRLDWATMLMFLFVSQVQEVGELPTSLDGQARISTYIVETTDQGSPESNIAGAILDKINNKDGTDASHKKLKCVIVD